ncbi:ribosome biogenesis GTP-binding protein YihA/YsxC [Arhodomonas sp. SL1]|uniref:ribosome biogenesis GTP-binding protein YihA/YsxC n=1 Tax=Arhodomonas sp. SL1 TaxID=3425691 RepID=UPI003F8809F2
MNPLYHKARFLLSAPDITHLPPDTGAEVAFAGRSNAGKSSAINALTGQKSLARISKTPGRTQAINVFPLDEERRLIDLPGYGYAKVPERIRAHWRQALPRYLAERESLRGLVIIMDVRRPLTEQDAQMLEWCTHAGLSVHVLLTKADKLKRGPALNALQRLRARLDAEYPATTAQLFSASHGTGIDEIHRKLDEWLEVAGHAG